jgi:hypothetical protein
LAGTLRDDFGDGNLNEWTTISFVDAGGTYSVEDSKLTITRNSIWSGGIYIGEDNWTDYSIECDAILHDKLANWSLICVGLRLQGNEQQWQQAWLNFGFQPDGTFAQLAIYNHPNWLQDIKKPMTFEIGRAYHLKGAATGNEFQFYIDGELVGSDSREWLLFWQARSVCEWRCCFH